MPFGKFIPARNDIITRRDGTKTTLNTPPGYGGLFWGRVYDKDGQRIHLAEEYFYELAKTNKERSDFTYWEIIDAEIGKHCDKYIGPFYKSSHHYQYGFGGDESDGIIDFWLPEQVPEMPPMVFEIRGEKYTIEWEYSSGDD